MNENLLEIRKTIAEAARKTGANPGEIVLVGVTKTQSLETVKQALDSGLSDIGENSLQEAEEKFPFVSAARKHFIGHLQGNKVKRIVAICDMIQSVDSLVVANSISDSSLATGKRMPVLVQILTDEKKQSGVRPGDLEAFLRNASELEGIRIQGLMTIGPLYDTPEQSRPVFKAMKKLFERARSLNIPNIELRYLSMGMSSDFGIAIEEGANMVRVGTALFGDLDTEQYPFLKFSTNKNNGKPI